MGAREDFQQLWDRFGRRRSAGRKVKKVCRNIQRKALQQEEMGGALLCRCG